MMTDRTSDLQLASYLIVRGYTLQAIEGPPGRRTFVFASAFPADVVMQFHGSSEKKILDAHKSLKLAAVMSA